MKDLWKNHFLIYWFFLSKVPRSILTGLFFCLCRRFVVRFLRNFFCVEGRRSIVRFLIFSFVSRRSMSLVRFLETFVRRKSLFRFLNDFFFCMSKVHRSIPIALLCHEGRMSLVRFLVTFAFRRFLVRFLQGCFCIEGSSFDSWITSCVSSRVHRSIPSVFFCVT